MSTTVAIHALHTAVQGRARYKVSGLYRSPALKRHLEVRLTEQAGIQCASASTLTGNILILFHPDMRLATLAALLTHIVADYVSQSSDASHCAVRHPPAPANGSQVNRSASAERTAPRRHHTTRHAAGHGPTQDSAPWHCLATDTVMAAFGTPPHAG